MKQVFRGFALALETTAFAAASVIALTAALGESGAPWWARAVGLLMYVVFAGFTTICAWTVGEAAEKERERADARNDYQPTLG